MQMNRRAIRRWFAIGSAIGAIRLTSHVLSVLVQKRLNPTLAKPPYGHSDATEVLCNRLLIADLHADPLLWDRNLARRSSIGHVDIPRLRAGHVALQIFGVVTKVPRPERDETFARGADLITLLSMIEAWPPQVWFNPTKRALYEARKLRRLEKRSAGLFVVITSRDGLTEFLDRRVSDPRLVAGVLALEGAHALGADSANLDALHAAGFRVVGLTHLFDNELGGASLGAECYGLTQRGREVVHRLEKRRIIIDLAHASPALFHDVLEATLRPVLVSHTGAQGVCPNPRNLSDSEIRQVADRGGVIGIGFDRLFTGARGIQPIVDSIRYVADLVGVEHVALGSDFDGAIEPPFDVSGMPLLADHLMNHGFTDGEVEKIMGGNVFRFLMENLP